MAELVPNNDIYLDDIMEQSAKVNKLLEFVKQITEDNTDLLKYFSEIQQVSDDVQELNSDLPELIDWKTVMQDVKQQSIQLTESCKRIQESKNAFKEEMTRKYSNSGASSEERIKQLESIVKTVENLQSECFSFSSKLSEFTKLIESTEEKAEDVQTQLVKLEAEARSQRNWDFAKSIGGLLGMIGLAAGFVTTFVLSAGKAEKVLHVISDLTTEKLFNWAETKLNAAEYFHNKSAAYLKLAQEMQLYKRQLGEIRQKLREGFNGNEQQEAMKIVLESIGQEIREKQELAQKESALLELQLAKSLTDADNLRLQRENDQKDLALSQAQQEMEAMRLKMERMEAALSNKN